MPKSILHTLAMVKDNPDFIELLSTEEQISLAMMETACELENLFGLED